MRDFSINIKGKGKIGEGGFRNLTQIWEFPIIVEGKGERYRNLTGACKREFPTNVR